MAIESDLKAALAGIAGDRIYPDTTPDNVTFPCIVYQQVGGDVVEFVEGEVASLDNARMQVWVWAKTRLSASSIARQVRLALVEGSMKATTLGAPVSEYNDTLKLYGNRTDYSLWFTP